jgi:DNA mismatch repair protein MutL
VEEPAIGSSCFVDSYALEVAVMGRIKKMDERLANKIAAGEVVERPASIVKELVENALDAGATSVQIEVEEGGLRKIKVTDNGHGFLPEDCEAAFERHATSKIRDEHDLFHIRTLGFRGEALPSIASVSRVELLTGTGEGPGRSLVIQGGEILESGLAPSNRGTEMTVTQLFYNTPARLKHLKTIHTELANITDVVNRLALASPDVRFLLTHDGKILLRTNGNGDLAQVLAAIYGYRTAKASLSFSEESLDFKVYGRLVKPEITRAGRQYVYLFINGRFIRHYGLFNAVLRGYHTLLPIGRYPIAVIHIETDPALIDVNVHPAKLEARISKEKELCELVERAIRETFHKERLIPSVGARPKGEKGRSEQQAFRFETFSDGSAAAEPSARDYVKETSPLWTDGEGGAEKKASAPGTPDGDRRPAADERETDGDNRMPELGKPADEDRKHSAPHGDERDFDRSGAPAEQVVPEAERTAASRPRPVEADDQSARPDGDGAVQTASSIGSGCPAFHERPHDTAALHPPEFGPEEEERPANGFTKDRADATERQAVHPDGLPETAGTGPTTEARRGGRMPVLYPIGQLHGTYILAQNESGLYLIDQHAAQERIKYEYFREKVAETDPEVQELLLPLTFEFSAAEYAIIEQYFEFLKSLGFAVEPFGPRSIIVRAHPRWLPRGREKEMIEAIVQELLERGNVSVKELREDLAIMMACKKSIKANHHLRPEEIEALLADLAKAEDPFTCPHGRPVIVHISTYELEKMFKRVM